MNLLENLFDAHKIAWHRPQLTQAKPAGKPLVKAVNERKIFLFRKQFHEPFSGLCPRKLRRSKRDERKFRESLCVIAQALVKTFWDFNGFAASFSTPLGPGFVRT